MCLPYPIGYSVLLGTVLVWYECNLRYATFWHRASCCHRYEPNDGLLTLVSERHSMREENRRHIMQTITNLVVEGHQAFPSQDVEASADQLEQEHAA